MAPSVPEQQNSHVRACTHTYKGTHTNIDGYTISKYSHMCSYFANYLPHGCLISPLFLRLFHLCLLSSPAASDRVYLRGLRTHTNAHTQTHTHKSPSPSALSLFACLALRLSFTLGKLQLSSNFDDFTLISSVVCSSAGVCAS